MSEEITIKVKENIMGKSPSVDGPSMPMIDPVLRGFFRVNDSEISDKDRSKLDEINDFLGDVPEMERIMALKDIRYKLGSPSLGVSSLDHFHKYIRIKNAIKQKEAELISMEE